MYLCFMGPAPVYCTLILIHSGEIKKEGGTEDKKTEMEIKVERRMRGKKVKERKKRGRTRRKRDETNVI